MKNIRIEGTSTKPRKPRGKSILEYEQYHILIEEWHPANYWGPECFSPGSSYEALWICRKTKLEHIFQAPIHWRTNAINNDLEHQGCTSCSPRKPPIPFEPLDNNLAGEWLSRLNEMPSKGLSKRSSRLGLWRCGECKHEWRTKVTSRTCRESQHCPSCFAKHSPNSAINLRNKANSVASNLFDEDAKPLRRNAGYDKRHLPQFHKVFWTCAKQRHRWYESYASLKNRDFLCPKCSKTLNDYRDLKKQYKPYLNDGFKAKEIIIEKNSRKKFIWKCEKGADHVWKARLWHRISETRKTGCPFCAGRKLSSSNSLAACFPSLAAEIHPHLNGSIDKKSITKNSTKKLFWLAECGHVWQTQVRLRTQRGYGCPKCKQSKQNK